jgi:hypothetical protein
LPLDSAAFSSVRGFFSGVEVVLQRSRQKLLVLIGRQLCNVGLERLFFGLSSGSAGDAAVTLSTAFAVIGTATVTVSNRSETELTSILLSGSVCVKPSSASASVAH